MSAEESESLVEALGLRFDEEDDHVQESVAKFRRRTCTDKDAVFSSKEHLMIVATYASLRTARVTLGDAEMRSKYDEQERVKAREYAEDVDDDNTYLGAAKRKVFGDLLRDLWRHRGLDGRRRRRVSGVRGLQSARVHTERAAAVRAVRGPLRKRDFVVEPGLVDGVHARVLRAEYGPRGDALGVCRVPLPLQFVGDCVEINQ